MPCKLPMSSIFSFPVRNLKTAASCGQTPIRSLILGISFRISKPPIWAVPAEGANKPHKHADGGGFPAPFGPRKPNSSPFRISRFNPFTALTSSKFFTRSLITISLVHVFLLSIWMIENFSIHSHQNNKHKPNCSDSY